MSSALLAGDVKLVRKFANDPEALEHAGIARSAYVIVLANDPEAPLSDSLSFDIVSRVREVNQRCEVISQCVDDRNRSHLLAAGANVVMRPVRVYPEIIVTSLLNPGSMDVLANLFSGADERIEVVRGTFRGTWSTLVSDMLARDAGLPIAALLPGGQVLTAPPARRMIEADGLYVISSAKNGRRRRKGRP